MLLMDQYTSQPVAGDGGTARAGGPSPASGEAVSITCLAHVTLPPEGQFLACGIDTLQLSLQIDWTDSDWEARKAVLEAEKLRAVGTNGSISSDFSYLMFPSGKPPSYRWHLQFPEFHLYLGASESVQGHQTNGLVQLLSKALWSQGLTGVLEQLHVALERWGGRITAMKPSRCDLAADFLLERPLILDEILEERVPSNVAHSHHMRDVKTLETFYHGAKQSPVQLRIYDKKWEVATHRDKVWFHEIWGPTTDREVWRVEYQMRREILRQLRIDTIEELQRQLAGLWRYLTHDWFSLRRADNAHTTRRTINPWWRTVVETAERFGPGCEVRRVFTGEPADSRWYVTHIAGCLAGFAASEGLSEFDESVTLLMERVQRYWKSRGFSTAVHAKLLKLGVGVEPEVALAPPSADRLNAA
jgi:hypothetical protein